MVRLRAGASLAVRWIALTALPLALLGVAACGERGGAGAHSNRPPVETTARLQDQQIQRRDLLLSASEAFEIFADGALLGDFAALDVQIQRLHAAAARALPALTPEQGAELVQRINLIEAARDTQARPDMALAAAEGFRLLTIALPPGAVPAEVSLLDYSGLRFGADLADAPPRWADAAAAADGAGAQWDQIAPRIADVSLRGRFGAAIIDLKRAARTRNLAKARAALKAQRGLIDELETAFSPRAEHAPA